MSLDISFYAVPKYGNEYRKRVGYFADFSFILNYFNISDAYNVYDVGICKGAMKKFIDDLKDELVKHDLGLCDNDIPINDRFKFKYEVFGGCSKYNGSYWTGLKSVYDWARSVFKSTDWTKNDLVIVSWR